MGTEKKNDTEKDDKPIRGVRKTGRGCTDVIFLILLIICWIGMVKNNSIFPLINITCILKLRQ